MAGSHGLGADATVPEGYEQGGGEHQCGRLRDGRVPLSFAPAFGGRYGLVVGVLFDIFYLVPIPVPRFPVPIGSLLNHRPVSGV